MPHPYERLQSYLPAGVPIFSAEESELREPPQRNERIIPAMSVDRRPTSWKGDVVCIGNEQGTYAPAMHLIDKGGEPAAEEPRTLPVERSAGRAVIG